MSSSTSISPFADSMAGMIAGSVSTLILTPVDLLTVRLQVGDRGMSKGLVPAARELARLNGFRSLWNGVTPNVISSALAWGLYFALYNNAKAALSGGAANDRLSAGQHLMASASAGAVTAVTLNPLWLLKARLFTQNGGAKRYPGGMVDGFARIWREEGVRGLYRGTSMGLAGVSSGAVQWTVYEQLKLKVSDRKRHERGESIDQSGAETLSNLEYMAVAGVAKETAVLSTYPYQVVRSRLQYDEKAFGGVRDCVQRTWASGGIRAFYRGVVPTAIRVLPGTAVTFLLYENLSAMLKSTTIAKQGIGGLLSS